MQFWKYATVITKCPKYGIEYTYVPVGVWQPGKQLFRRTKMIYLETPTNPGLDD
jgi:cystathionine beta-lyase/cystathionine gamma-synthase